MIKIEAVFPYAGYSDARAIDSSGNLYVWMSASDGTAFREDGALVHARSYKRKSPGQQDYRHLSVDGAERIAPELEAALKAHLTPKAEPRSPRQRRMIRAGMREQLTRGHW